MAPTARQPSDEAAIVLIAGKKGSGKTTLHKTIINSYLDEVSNIRFVHYDVTREIVARDRLVVMSSLEYTPTEFIEFCLDYAPCVASCDEAVRVMPRGKDIDPNTPLGWVAFTGRHVGVGCLFSTQRLVKINPDIRTNVDTIFLFRHSTHLDLYGDNGVDKWCGGPEWAEATKALPDHEWLRCDV